MAETMEMSPLERAARALDKAIPRSEGGTFYVAPGWSKDMIVRAVLQAIREPSEGMLEGFGIHKSRMRQNWQDMVDAALAE